MRQTTSTSAWLAQRPAIAVHPSQTAQSRKGNPGCEAAGGGAHVQHDDLIIAVIRRRYSSALRRRPGRPLPARPRRRLLRRHGVGHVPGQNKPVGLLLAVEILPVSHLQSFHSFHGEGHIPKGRNSAFSDGRRRPGAAERGAERGESTRVGVRGKRVEPRQLPRTSGDGSGPDERKSTGIKLRGRCADTHAGRARTQRAKTGGLSRGVRASSCTLMCCEKSSTARFVPADRAADTGPGRLRVADLTTWMRADAVAKRRRARRQRQNVRMRQSESAAWDESGQQQARAPGLPPRAVAHAAARELLEALLGQAVEVGDLVLVQALGNPRIRTQGWRNQNHQ